MKAGVLCCIANLVLAASAGAATVTVTHTGLGSGVVNGGAINCGAGCTADLEDGTSITLQYQSDSSGAELIGWGGACIPYEARSICTVTAGSLMEALYHGSIPVIFHTGYYRDGLCRAYGGLSQHVYFNDLQTAYNTVAAGAASPPIECVANKYLSIGTINSPTEISGGWGSFAPNAAPEPGSTSIITGALVVGTGSLTISGAGGITLACGYRTVTGSYTVTEPLIIGATPCDFGLIIQ